MLFSYCSGGQLLVMSSENGVTLYNPRNNETTVLINSTRLVSEELLLHGADLYILIVMQAMSP